MSHIKRIFRVIRFCKTIVRSDFMEQGQKAGAKERREEKERILKRVLALLTEEKLITRQEQLRCLELFRGEDGK